jgi:SAM-dependent methyltransferase
VNIKDPRNWPLSNNIYLIGKPMAMEMFRLAPKAKGTLVDVGGSDTMFYEFFKPHIKKYICINLKKTKNKADENIIGNAEKIPLKNNSAETVLHTCVLEHLEKPETAVNEVHRILKKDGYCILTTNMAWIYHPDPKDCYRFTKDGLNYLFRNFSEVKIKAMGGAFLTMTEFLILALSKIPIISTPIIMLLNTIAIPIDKLFYDERLTPVFIVIAKK